MSTELTRMITQLFPALLLAVLGFVVLARGPQGFVHGLVDWSKIDAPTRQRAGRMVGNVFFAMAALIAGRAFYAYRYGSAAADSPFVEMVFVGGLSVLLLVMILRLLCLPTQDKNDRHGH